MLFNNKWRKGRILDLSGRKSETLEIKLIESEPINNMSQIFHSYTLLQSLPDIKWNTENVTDMSEMFYDCKLLNSLPDIYKWNTKNVTNMSEMFYDCKSLNSLPDIYI